MSNSAHTQSYDRLTRLLHWGMAIAIIAMFGLGVWMRTLGYFDPWYTRAPYIHRSVGMLLLVLLVIRFVWRLRNLSAIQDHQPNDAAQRVARIVHWAFYAILLIIMVSGYLISTADGRGIDVFGLVTVPSIYQNTALPDVAGLVHEYVAYLLMALVALHAAAALKHHFIDRDQILLRMLRDPHHAPPERDPPQNREAHQ